MKLTIILASALTGALLTVPAFADTKIVLGCEVKTVPGTNYSNKVDPNCQFAVTGDSGGSVIQPKILPGLKPSLDLLRPTGN